MDRRLLLVDDEARFGRTVARTAAALGYATELCNDAERALDAFIAFRPHVVMIDLCMPEKDGIEVADEIMLTGIPVGIIFISGYGAGFLRTAKDLARFHDHPNVALLSKPFRREELDASLRSVCNDAQEPSEDRPAFEGVMPMEPSTAAP